MNEAADWTVGGDVRRPRRVTGASGCFTGIRPSGIL